MQKLCFVLIVFLLGVSAFGQVQPQPTPDRQAEMRRQQEEMEARRRLMHEQARLRSVSERARRGRPVAGETLKDLRELYRKPSDKELKKLRPAAEDLKQYAAFLKQSNTGMIRLEPYKGCGDETVVFSASDACLEYRLPGNGSDYSFRERNYRLGRLADLRFDGESFSSPGVLQLGIMAGLGDVALEKAGLDTPGMAYITSFKPAEETSVAVALGEEFTHGTEKNGFYYASAVRAVGDMTYVLRSIAYRGSVMRSMGGVVFNELDLDERADVIVVFRMIRKHASGGVTILWKELDRKRSPEFGRDKPPAPTRTPFTAGRYRAKEK